MASLEYRNCRRESNVVFGSAQILLEKAYACPGEGYGRDAVELMEEYGQPLVDYIHGDRDEIPEFETGVRTSIKEEYGKVFTNPSFRFNVGDEIFDEYHTALTDNFEPGEFDQVVGVYASGIPPLYLASETLDAEPIVERYSCVRRNDNEVSTLPVMEQKRDYENSSILLVDDVVESGETARKIAEEILDHNPERLVMMPAQRIPKGSEKKERETDTVENEPFEIEDVEESTDPDLAGIKATLDPEGEQRVLTI